MKKQILFLALGWVVCSLLSPVVASAGIGQYSTSSGYVVSWDKKKVVLFSKGRQIHVPRQAFGKARLKRGQYVSKLTYKLSDFGGKKKSRRPASKK